MCPWIVVPELIPQLSFRELPILEIIVKCRRHQPFDTDPESPSQSARQAQNSFATFKLSLLKTMNIGLFHGLLILCALAISPLLCAQDNERRLDQFWLTAEFRYPVSVAILWKTNLEYRSVRDAGERWRTWNFSGEVSFFSIPAVDLTGALRVFYSQENDTLNRTELRPTVGVSVNILRKGRFVIDDRLRFEWRQFFFNFSDLNRSFGRFRNKTNLLFALNKKNPYLDKALSLRLSFEFFMIRDKHLKERFANRHRLEAGLGFRFNDHWRLWLIYYSQYSRNQIEESFNTRENILRLRGTYSL